ncbi:Uncharacterised protein [Mycobacteroides abscessus subsp. abscessus]|nr:Uncharacterised protein [Mycobacteroides abscessus subsp. abscessus]
MLARDAVAFISTDAPALCGYMAVKVPPIIPPQELPTTWVRSIPRESSICVMACAQSSKRNIRVSDWLSPWPGGSTRITV